MTLEVLFARAEQGRVFLVLTVGGLALGLLLQLAGWLHRWRRAAGMTADLLCALTMLLMLVYAAFAAGTGLRLYALLGLCIGLAVYFAGVGCIVEAVVRWLQKRFPRKAGKPG